MIAEPEIWPQTEGMTIHEWDSQVRQFIAIAQLVENPKQKIGRCLYGLTREAALKRLDTKQFKFIEWNKDSKENLEIKIR